MSKQIILNEENLMDIYRKLAKKDDFSPEEVEQVKKRFYELVNYQPS